MNNINNIGRSVALATSTLALGSALAVSSNISSAQAAALGTFNGTGSATIGNLSTATPATDVIKFSNPFTTTSASGIFSGLAIQSIEDIKTTFVNTIGTFAGTTFSNYTAVGANTPLIKFNNGYTFQANPATFDAVRSFKPTANGNNVGYSFDLLGKLFNAAGTPVTSGLLTVNDIGDAAGDPGSFSLTLTAVSATPTPEPTTTLGLAALGLGTFLTNNLAKQKKAKVKA